MFERRQQGVQLVIVEAAFVPTAPGRWRAGSARLDEGGDAMGHLQSFQAGGGQDDGVNSPASSLAGRVLTLPRRSRITRSGARSAQLALTAQAGGADHGPLRQLVYLVEMVGNKGIARVFALTDGVQAESVGELPQVRLSWSGQRCRHALPASGLQFLDEQPCRRPWRGGVEDLVTLGAHGHQFDLQIGWSASSRSFLKLACHRGQWALSVAILRVRAAISISCFIF